MSCKSRVLFSTRMKYQELFNSWAKEHKVKICAINFIAWLQSEEKGKELIKLLYQEIE